MVSRSASLGAGLSSFSADSRVRRRSSASIVWLLCFPGLGRRPPPGDVALWVDVPTKWRKHKARKHMCGCRHVGLCRRGFLASALAATALPRAFAAEPADPALINDLVA